MRQNADILIRNITVYTQDEQRRVLPETDVAIREGTNLLINFLYFITIS